MATKRPAIDGPAFAVGVMLLVLGPLAGVAALAARPVAKWIAEASSATAPRSFA